MMNGKAGEKQQPTLVNITGVRLGKTFAQWLLLWHCRQHVARCKLLLVVLHVAGVHRCRRRRNYRQYVFGNGKSIRAFGFVCPLWLFLCICIARRAEKSLLNLVYSVCFSQLSKGEQKPTINIESVLKLQT